MEKEFVLTNDGSYTIYLPELKETYHSKNGAVQESIHVYLKNGLDLIDQHHEISILEIGFGTGLNALLTFAEAKKRKIRINYHTTEAFPLQWKEAEKTNYTQIIPELEFYKKIHECKWNEPHQINNFFQFTKHFIHFENIDFVNQFDIIYFDVFGYDIQPELWSEIQFKKMHKALKNNGLLTTYACRSIIIQNMRNAGFVTEKKEGAPGKREMLNAKKIEK